MAKARVESSKITSISLLELSASVISAKINVMLKTELQISIDDELCWTDTQVVLAYIKNEGQRIYVFVAHRVPLIRESTGTNQWHYDDTSQNPADHASRGLPAADIFSASWLSGPKFVREPPPKPVS